VEAGVEVEVLGAGSVEKTVISPGIAPAAKEVVAVEGPVASVGKRAILLKTAHQLSQRNVSSVKKKGTRRVNASCQMFAENARLKATWPEIVSSQTSATDVGKKAIWSETVPSRR